MSPSKEANWKIKKIETSRTGKQFSQNQFFGTIIWQAAKNEKVLW